MDVETRKRGDGDSFARKSSNTLPTESEKVAVGKKNCHVIILFSVVFSPISIASIDCPLAETTMEVGSNEFRRMTVFGYPAGIYFIMGNVRYLLSDFKHAVDSILLCAIWRCCC